MLKRLLSGSLAFGILLGAGGMFAVGQGLGITGTNTENRNSIFQAGMLRVTRDEAITATVGGAQAGAYQIIYGMNRVTTVASSGDSVKLPICAGGKVVFIVNAAASNALNLYGQTGETINALSANTAFSLAANKAAIATCGTDGAWYVVLTA